MPSRRCSSMHSRFLPRFFLPSRAIKRRSCSSFEISKRIVTAQFVAKSTSAGNRRSSKRPAHRCLRFTCNFKQEGWPHFQLEPRWQVGSVIDVPSPAHVELAENQRMLFGVSVVNEVFAIAFSAARGLKARIWLACQSPPSESLGVFECLNSKHRFRLACETVLR